MEEGLVFLVVLFVFLVVGFFVGFVVLVGVNVFRFFILKLVVIFFVSVWNFIDRRKLRRFFGFGLIRVSFLRGVLMGMFWLSVIRCFDICVWLVNLIRFLWCLFCLILGVLFNSVLRLLYVLISFVVVLMLMFGMFGMLFMEFFVKDWILIIFLGLILNFFMILLGLIFLFFIVLYIWIWLFINCIKFLLEEMIVMFVFFLFVWVV